MKFKKSDLKEITHEDNPECFKDIPSLSKFKPVYCEIESVDDHGVRTYEQVFQYEGRYYQTNYITDLNNISPYEYEPEEIECIEVRQVVIEQVQYEAVSGG